MPSLACAVVALISTVFITMVAADSSSATICPGYVLETDPTPTTSGTGIEAELTLHRHRVGNARCAALGPDYDRLKFEAVYDTPERLHLTIADFEGLRWRVPQSIVPRPGPQMPPSNCLSRYQLSVSKHNEPFGFSISRSSSSAGSNANQMALFSTVGLNLVFKEQYMEVSTHLPLNANIYGLGETTRPNFRLNPNNTRATIWTRDAANPPNENVYGAHPFYIEIRDGKAHGVLLVSSVGMDVILSPGKLTYKVLGGVLEWYFLLGPTPMDVLRQYTEIVGRPIMPPYWSMAWHQCRWGYQSIDEVEEVVKRYNSSQMPLETMWIDIDYMDAYKDFTFDPVKYPLDRMQKFQQRLRQNHQKLVLIVDPGIKIESGHGPYDTGLQSNVFIKNPRNGNQPFIGKVWPGRTHFPDWFHPNATNWWSAHIRSWLQAVPLDGIWIDMNEIANFCERGDCDHPSRFDRHSQIMQVPGAGKFPFDPNAPPYRIDNGGKELPLNHRTSPMDGTHYGGVVEYFAHNLYGHMESEATYKALKAIDPSANPFVLTRSSFLGTGRFAAHWLGDNWSTFESMRNSISGLFNFASVFAIPMVGADICGFLENADEELCVRWTQLGGVAYPFARNHNWNEGKPQEPYLWPAVIDAMQKYVYGVRYKMLPYWYTLHQAANQHGEVAVVRSMLWQFTGSGQVSVQDEQQLVHAESQIMIGSAVLVTPVLERGARTVLGYFPRGTFFDYFNGKIVADSLGTGRWLELQAPLDSLPLHIRGGNIIPLHESLEGMHQTRQLQRRGRYELLVAVDFNAVRGECNFQSAVVAKGRMFLDNDDGGLLLAPGVKASVELSFTATARFSSLLDVVDGEGRRMKQSSNIIDLAIDSVVVRDEISSAADYESAAKVQIRQIRVYGMRSLANAMDKCRLSSDGLQFQSTADSPVKSIKDNVDDEFVYKTIVRPGLSVTTSSTTQLYFTGKAYYEE